MAQLSITYETLDAVAGLQSNYSSHILGPNPSKRFGPMSLTAVMGALGMKFIAVEDPEAFARVRPRLVQRQRADPPRPHWRTWRRNVRTLSHP